MRSVLITLAVVCCLAQSLPLCAQTATTPTDPQLHKELTSIENKYFEHDFSRETADYRLQRLEKFTFGATGSGDSASRMKRLLAVTNLSSDPPIYSPTGSSSSSDSSSAPQATPNSSAPKKSTPSTSAPSKSLTSSPTKSPAPAQSGQTQSYPHISNLEREILGQTYESDTLNDRLDRMEVKAFGAARPNVKDYSTRTDALEDYAESKLHQKPYAENPDMAPERLDPSSSSITKRRLVGLGNTALGLAGLGGAGMGVYPMNPLPAAEEPEEKPVDPAVFKEAPPDAHARLLTRIGWCEQHLYNKTFPDMHLLSRLHQLNSTLFPQDHEKDIDLMDRVDVIVKEVVMRQHPPTHP